MMDANDFEETETLKNGVTVKVRAIRPADKAGIAGAFGRLDPESDLPVGRPFQADKTKPLGRVTYSLPLALFLPSFLGDSVTATPGVPARSLPTGSVADMPNARRGSPGKHGSAAASLPPDRNRLPRLNRTPDRPALPATRVPAAPSQGLPIDRILLP